MPFLVKKYIEEAKSLNDENSLIMNKKDYLIERDYTMIFKNAFNDCDHELIKEQRLFDVKLSGSTVCTVLFDGTRIHCANAGDSRAMTVRIFK